MDTKMSEKNTHFAPPKSDNSYCLPLKPLFPNRCSLPAFPARVMFSLPLALQIGIRVPQTPSPNTHAFASREVLVKSGYLRVLLLSFLITVVLGGITLTFGFRSLVRANRIDLRSVARMYPNFSIEQRTAMLRLVQSQLHPDFREMSLMQKMREIARALVSPENGTPPPANFAGNLTTIVLGDNHLLALSQQADCSLALRDATYNLNYTGMVLNFTVANSVPHYEQVLHNSAGLTTTAGNYPSGCGNSQNGVTSRKIVFAGATASNLRVYIDRIYNPAVDLDQAFVIVADATDNFKSFTNLAESNDVVDVATADLNGDGNGDVVLIGNSPTVGGAPAVSVALGKADGSFGALADIPLSGSTLVYSAVIDDFNGDGKKDIVVASTNGPANSGGTTYYLDFFAGNGDGTFQAAKSYTVTPPSGLLSNPYNGLISADLRGSGHKDLITSAGIILFGNGDGTFTQSGTAAFPDSAGTSNNSPNVIAGDFNKDGKLDLAVNNGDTFAIYTGKGDGTFTAFSSYTAFNNVGYLVAQDLDGDGNLDLFSGTGNYGSLGGDQFDYNAAYALIGNGDGTFHGAPVLPFVYTGTNLADLNKDGAADGVGVSGTSFLSYVNNGKGGFTQSAALTYSPITINGGSFTPNSIDSYGLADLNGDNIPDLVYVSSNFYGPNAGTGFNGPGFFVATGKGDGSFNAPAGSPQPPSSSRPTSTSTPRSTASASPT